MSTSTGHRANIDHREIDKFEALASRWWDPNSECRPLHDCNPLRLDYIDRLAVGLSGKKIIDVGCGGGILAESMAQRGATVTGIDMGKAALNVARLHALESKLDIDYRQVTAEALADEEAETYDIVTCLEMLEHVPDPASIVSACARLARPGGQLFFSTINRNPQACLYAIVGAEYILQLLPRGTHDYKKLIRPSELGRFAHAAALRIHDLTGMSYNPFSKTYRLGKNIRVNYLMHCSKAG